MTQCDVFGYFVYCALNFVQSVRSSTLLVMAPYVASYLHVHVLLVNVASYLHVHVPRVVKAIYCDTCVFGFFFSSIDESRNGG